jgi:16S rRNA (cytosine1402-N4)-methyltransferase
MRMDPQSTLTARQVVNEYPVEALADAFRTYGEERRAGRIARQIARDRAKRSIETTQELRQSILRSGAAPRGRWRIDPAPRVFQALRIVVNNELASLEQFLRQVVEYLAPGGRLVVISFHSLEDRVVKRFMTRAAGRRAAEARPVFDMTAPEPPRPAPTLRLLTKKPLRPTPEESAENPRARSARLRAAERLETAGPPAPRVEEG